MNSPTDLQRAGDGLRAITNDKVARSKKTAAEVHAEVLATAQKDNWVPTSPAKAEE